MSTVGLKEVKEGVIAALNKALNNIRANQEKEAEGFAKLNKADAMTVAPQTPGNDALPDAGAGMQAVPMNKSGNCPACNQGCLIMLGELNGVNHNICSTCGVTSTTPRQENLQAQAQAQVDDPFIQKNDDLDKCSGTNIKKDEDMVKASYLSRFRKSPMVKEEVPPKKQIDPVTTGVEKPMPGAVLPGDKKIKEIDAEGSGGDIKENSLKKDAIPQTTTGAAKHNSVSSLRHAAIQASVKASGSGLAADHAHAAGLHQQVAAMGGPEDKAVHTKIAQLHSNFSQPATPKVPSNDFSKPRGPQMMKADLLSRPKAAGSTTGTVNPPKLSAPKGALPPKTPRL